MANPNNPFLPVSFPKGPPTTVIWEDGPGIYANPINSTTPVYYNGQTQTFRINVSAVKPPREWGPGAADSAISRNYSASYSSDGYRDH